MATSRFRTAGDILNDAAVELGLTRPSFPFTSTDQNVILLRTLLNSCGQKLLKMRPWLGSTREASLTITAGDSGLYTVPDDFVSLVSQTSWNRLQPAPAMGPISGPDWQAIKARTSAGAFVSVPWRFVGNYWQTWPQPVARDAVVYVEYVSRAWVQTAAALAPDADAATAEGDTVMLESLMVQDFLKLRFLQAKGLPSDAALAEWEESYMHAAGAEPAEVLDLGGHSGGERFLDGWNLPDTGYGE